MDRRRRSVLSYIPGYTNNAVLQLIIFSGSAYVILGLTWGIMFLLYQGNDVAFREYFIPNISLPTVGRYGHYWWTIFTYGWLQYPNGFWELVSNMVWLYCFGSVVQVFVGHRQVIPIYAYGLVTGGLLYLAAQLLPGEWGKIPVITGLLGARGGLMAMAAAAVTLSPNYRFYVTETLRIPMTLVAGVFAFLMILGTRFYLPLVFLLAASGLTGFGYIRLLKAGFRPGGWMYRLTGSIAATVTPDERAIRKSRNQVNPANTRVFTQDRIDAILDKINQKGYNSLTSEEKDFLMRAGKE